VRVVWAEVGFIRLYSILKKPYNRQFVDGYKNGELMVLIQLLTNMTAKISFEKAALF